MVMVAESITVSKVFHATLDGLPGIAFSTIDKRYWFVTAGDLQPLTDADVPALVLLGDASRTAEEELPLLLDGGHAGRVCNSHRRLSREL